MERSLDRVLVTHAGALAKPPELASLVRAREEGESYDSGALGKAVAATARANVDDQLDAGIDLVNDGEPSKGSFNYCVRARLGGVEERVFPPGEGPLRLTANARGYVEFPEYFDGRMGNRALERRLAKLKAMVEGPGWRPRPSGIDRAIEKGIDHLCTRTTS